MIEGFSRHLQPSLSWAAPQASCIPLPPSAGLPSAQGGWPVSLRLGSGQPPCLVLPTTKPHVQMVTTVSTVLTFRRRCRPALRGAHICPCSVNPKQRLVGGTASLRRIWFCHGKGKGFLTSKFCWELDDSKESAPSTSYHMSGWELRGHTSVGHCGAGWM